MKKGESDFSIAFLKKPWSVLHAALSPFPDAREALRVGVEAAFGQRAAEREAHAGVRGVVHFEGRAGPGRRLVAAEGRALRDADVEAALPSQRARVVVHVAGAPLVRGTREAAWPEPRLVRRVAIRALRGRRSWRGRRALQRPQPQEPVAVCWDALRHEAAREVSQVCLAPDVAHRKAALRGVANVLKVQSDRQRRVEPIEQ